MTFISYFRKVTILGYGCFFALRSTAPAQCTLLCAVERSRSRIYKYFVMMLLTMFMYEFRSDHRNYNHIYVTCTTAHWLTQPTDSHSHLFLLLLLLMLHIYSIYSICNALKASATSTRPHSTIHWCASSLAATVAEFISNPIDLN